MPTETTTLSREEEVSAGASDSRTASQDGGSQKARAEHVAPFKTVLFSEAEEGWIVGRFVPDWTIGHPLRLGYFDYAEAAVSQIQRQWPRFKVLSLSRDLWPEYLVICFSKGAP